MVSFLVGMSAATYGVLAASKMDSGIQAVIVVACSLAVGVVAAAEIDISLKAYRSQK